MVLVVLALVSGISFVRYGVRVLREPRLRTEFDRYGLPRLRPIVGVLEILGGLGVLLGLAVAPLGALAAAGLTLLMVLGVVRRARLGDSVRLMFPALVLGTANGALVLLFLSR